MCVLSFISHVLSSNKEAIEAFKNLCEAAAIGIGGIWTYYFFVLKRQKFPRAKLEQKVLHWPLADGKTAVRVIVTIHNSGEVLLKLVKGFSWVQCVKPLHEKFEEPLKKGVDLVNENETEIQWPLVGERNYFRSEKMEIEPGENDDVNADFVIDSKVEKILIYSHVENEAKLEPSWLEKIKYDGEYTAEKKQQVEGGGIGWSVSTLFDLSGQ